MDTNDTHFLPREIMAELEAAARYAMSGVRDPEVMRRACERMDRMREENRKIYGVQDIGVDIIRALRDGEDEEEDE